MAKMITLQVKNGDLKTAHLYTESHSDQILVWAAKSLQDYIRLVHQGIPARDVQYCGCVTKKDASPNLHLYIMEYVPRTANFILVKDET